MNNTGNPASCFHGIKSANCTCLNGSSKRNVGCNFINIAISVGSDCISGVVIVIN